jgi:NCS1 family nucleobase:cation symporter-1
VEELYTLSPEGAFHYVNGWNFKAVAALGVSGALSIGLALMGAYGAMLNVGDWGWLIGAATGALVYRALSGQPSAELAGG